MNKLGTKIFKIADGIKGEKLAENTYEKIKEIVKENKDKSASEYLFFISEKVWKDIVKLLGYDLNKTEITILRWRGFNICSHKDYPYIFFGKLYYPDDYSSKELVEEVTKRLKEEVEWNLSDVIIVMMDIVNI